MTIHVAALVTRITVKTIIPVSSSWLLDHPAPRVPTQFEASRRGRQWRK